MTRFDISSAFRGLRRSVSIALCAGLLCLLPLTGAQAQEKPAAPPPANGGGTPGAPKSATAAPDYVISVEDVLSISVVDRPELARPGIQVLNDGTIDFPDIGIIKVAGKTIKDLKTEMQKALAKKYTRPQVNITIAGRQIRQINVFGSVASKGKLALRDGWRVRDVLAAAGGLASANFPPDRYEFYRAELNRAKGGETLPIDLNKLLGAGDESQNYAVEVDDTITVREVDVSEANVTVIGAVQKPGPQLTPRSGNIVDVLTAAGPIPDFSLLSAVEIEHRDGTSQKNIDLRGYNKPDVVINVKVKPGDRIIIPENKKRYYLYGIWAKPGEQVYPDDEKLTVFKVFGKVGQVQGAEVKNTKLIRTLPSGKTQQFKINVEKMLKTADLSEDMVVLPDDKIYVEPTRRNAWERIYPIIQVLSIGLGLYLTIKALR
jgi:protein involved in polysaccharide export with SLBB domain